MSAYLCRSRVGQTFLATANLEVVERDEGSNNDHRGNKHIEALEKPVATTVKATNSVVYLDEGRLLSKIMRLNHPYRNNSSCQHVIAASKGVLKVRALAHSLDSASDRPLLSILKMGNC